MMNKKMTALFILLLLAASPEMSFALKKPITSLNQEEQPCQLLKNASIFLGPGFQKIGWLKYSAKVFKNKHGDSWSRVIIDAWVKRKDLFIETDDPVTYTKRKKTWFSSYPQNNSLIGYYKAGTELALFPELGEDAQQDEWLRVMTSAWLSTKVLQEYSEPPIPVVPELPSEEIPVEKKVLAP